jgi:hypothetical protein
MSLEIPSVRLGARAIVFVLPLLGSVLLWGACTQPQYGNGQPCLKSDDCASGICSQLVCTASPPLTDAEATADSTSDASAVESGTEAAAPEAAAETGTDSGGD